MTRETPPPAPRKSRLRLRQLDGRTVGICVFIALIAALVAALATSALSKGDTKPASPSSQASLTPRTDVDTAKALGTTVLTFAGRRVTLAAQIGDHRPAVVNFFSSTCTPCVTEMPALERVHRSRRDISFIGVDVQDQVGPGRALIKRTGITYEALRDPPGDLLTAVGGVGLPTTLLINTDGRVVTTHTGALSEGDLRSLLHRKLG